MRGTPVRREIAAFAGQLSVGKYLPEMPMPHILLSPLVKWSLAAAGGAMVVQWVVTEVKRVNEELEARRARVRIRDQERRPTLRRDPVSGEFRL